MEAGVGTQSVISSSLLMMSAGIGTGVLVLPRAMADVGIVPMLGLLLVGCLLSAFTTWILFCAVARCRAGGLEVLLTPKGSCIVPGRDPSAARSDDGCWPSYAQLLRMVTPRWVSTLLDAMLVLYAEGAIMTYFLFVADFLNKLSSWSTRVDEHSTVALMACAVFVLSLSPSVGGLARLSFVGLAALSFMAVGIWVRAPELSAQRAAPLAAVKSLEAMPAVLCIGVYAFMWHTNCATVARELRDPTPKRCFMVAISSTSLLYCVYALIAFGGYLSWGDDLVWSKSVVAMYDEADPLFASIRLMLVAALVISTAINMYPLRESCVGLVRALTGLGGGGGGWSHALWGAAIVGVAAVLAVKFQDVVELVTLLGGTLATCMMLVFPSIIARMVLPPREWRLAMAVTFAFAALLLLAAVGLIGQPA